MEHYAKTGDSTYAAEKAGYRNPVIQGQQKRTSTILAPTIEETRNRLRTEGFSIGVGVLIDMAKDPKTPASTRRAAASDLVKYGGGDPAGDAAKEPHEMDSSELDKAIQRLQREAADRAKPIVDLEPNKDSDADIFD